MLDRFECYELCVQSPRHVVALLRGVHGNEPLVLWEDFAGSAAISCRWAQEAIKRGDAGRAMAVDLDSEASDRARQRLREANVLDRVAITRADSTRIPPDVGADVIFVGNFSIGYLHDRPSLVAYLRLCHQRLQRGNAGFGGGIFVCDTYGGATAFKLGGFERKHPGRKGEVIRYSWMHESADPLTSMVVNSISFRVEIDGEIVQEWPRAFVYHWRLWSITELRDAMAEAGFVSSWVYRDINIAPGQNPEPVSDPSTLGDDWIVLVVGRVN